MWVMSRRIGYLDDAAPRDVHDRAPQACSTAHNTISQWWMETVTTSAARAS
jgi:hypothetical protein